MPYRIAYTADALDHLGSLTARQRALILNAVDVQLVHQPTVPTRNRKPMRTNALADWELRVGDLRVYYRVTGEPEPEVEIQAVGVKVGSRVFIEDREVEL